MTTTYKYRPFSSPRTIRVLDLQPSPSFNAPLRCNFLRETSLDNLTPYHALSYVWGSTVGRVELFCEGKTILVTANCEQALRSLRRSKTVFTLWVDAVCIDQSSVSERSQQVQLMGDIYRKAKEVIVWLGRGHKKLEESFHTLKVASPVLADSVWGGMNRLSRLRYAALLRRSKCCPSHFTTKFSRCVFSLSGYGIEYQLTNLLSKGYHWDIETCSIICNNSWFRRIWTAQEQLLARNLSVAYGTEVISWDVFVCLITCLEPLKSGRTLSEELLDVDKQISIDLPLEPAGFRMASRLRFKKLQYDLSSTGRLAATEDRQYIYDTILYVCRTSQCTDSRDKVYGIYGMLPILDEELPIIDYSKTVERIYEETAKCIIRSFGALEILALAQWKRELPGLPSWVPDFSVTASGFDYDLEIIHGARVSRLWSGSGHSTIEMNTFWGSKPGQLALKGRILTNVREVGAKWPSTWKVGVGGENGLWGIFISWLHFNVSTYPRPNDMEIVINSLALAELFLPQYREEVRNKILSTISISFGNAALR
jgi:hypothetical protein